MGAVADEVFSMMREQCRVLSRSEIAEALGVNEGAVSRYLRDEKTTLYAIADEYRRAVFEELEPRTAREAAHMLTYTNTKLFYDWHRKVYGRKFKKGGNYGLV